VIGVEPFHVPDWTVSVWPDWAVPEMDGAEAFDGAVPVVVDPVVVEPVVVVSVLVVVVLSVVCVGAAEPAVANAATSPSAKIATVVAVMAKRRRDQPWRFSFAVIGVFLSVRT
jgi:hypothetical protein